MSVYTKTKTSSTQNNTGFEALFGRVYKMEGSNQSSTGDVTTSPTMTTHPLASSVVSGGINVTGGASIASSYPNIPGTNAVSSQPLPLNAGTVTIVGKQGDLTPTAALVVPGGLRAPSPAPSEASTASSNQSLDLMRCKKCSVDSCQEMVVVAGKRRKGPVMCNYHRNKTYKAKKKQRDQLASDMQFIKKKQEESLPKPPNLQALLNADQPTPNEILIKLDQVLNEKKLALLRSPEIIQFLQESQEQLSNSHRQQPTPTLATPTMATPTPSTTGRMSSMSSMSTREEHFFHASPPKIAKGHTI